MYDLAIDVSQVLLANFWVIPLGTMMGIVAGALPGFSAANTLVVFLPLTLTMNPASGLIFMCAIFGGVRFGGAIPAILVNIPGTGSTSVTALDGYPMCVAGRPGEALGYAAAASFFGGFSSAIITLISAHFLAIWALKLSSVEIFILVVSAIVVVGSLTADLPYKGWLAGFLGLLIGAMGYDPMWAQLRGNFGLPWLANGVPVVPALVGLFAIAEVITFVDRRAVVEAEHFDFRPRDMLTAILRGARHTFRHRFNLVRSALIGTGVGALPGAGANIASFLAYQQTVANAADRSQFGKGDPRGIIAAETSDNAVASGSLIPLLTLGIPGSSSTAVMLVVMLSHGLSVGPQLIVNEPTLFYSILSSLLISNLWMAVLAIGVSVYMIRVVQIPTTVLAPAVVVLCLLGAYFTRGYIFDLWLALFFGIVGYVMRRTGYPPAALLLGIILTPVMEANFFAGLRMGFGDPLVFVTKPLAVCLWVLLFAALFLPSLARRFKRRNSKKPMEE